MKTLHGKKMIDFQHDFDAEHLEGWFVVGRCKREASRILRFGAYASESEACTSFRGVQSAMTACFPRRVVQGRMSKEQGGLFYGCRMSFQEFPRKRRSWKD